MKLPSGLSIGDPSGPSGIRWGGMVVTLQEDEEDEDEEEGEGKGCGRGLETGGWT